MRALTLGLLALAIPTLVVAAEVPTTRVELQELWRRGTDDDELFFGNIDRIVLDPAGNAYALDAQLSEVIVLSPDGEHLRTIGRPGEGPGEFRQGADLFYGLGDRIGVLQAFPGKIIQMDPQGTPLDNFRLPQREDAGFQVVLRAEANADRLVLAGTRQSMSADQSMQNLYLEAYTPEGELLAQYHEEQTPFQFGGMAYEESAFVSFQRRWTLMPDGRVAAPIDYLAYAIQVWNPDGSLDRVIERADYPPLARSQEQIDLTQQLFDAVITFNPRSTFAVSKVHPAISQIFARANGELWVATDRGVHQRPAGVAMVLDVFDREGRFVRQLEVHGDLDPVDDSFYFFEDRLYVVTGALGSAMSALSAGGSDGEALGAVEPSNIVCFEWVAAE